jgi:elongation factor P
MASTSDFKNGMCIEFKNGLYTIIEFQHVKPGKGPAFVRTKLKNVKTGKVIDNTFTAGVKVDEARIERRPHQYLYKDDMGCHFMDNSTYEQINLPEEITKDIEKFLKDGQEVEVIFHADTETPLLVELPPHIISVIVSSEPGIKGDTSSGTAMKPATIETGAIIQVPIFINEGESIRIDTTTGKYVERVKA